MLSSIVYIFDESVILSRFSHPVNANPSMAVMFSGIITFVKLLHQPNVELFISFMPLKFGKFGRLAQLKNAAPSIVVTLSGISILVRLVQYENACSPIVVTPDEIMTFVSLEQS